MKFSKILPIAAGMALAGCATTHKVATTFDGRAVDPARTAHLVAVCQSRGEIAATEVVPSAPSFALSSSARLGDSIGRGITDGIRRAEARNAVQANCYAENGVQITEVADPPQQDQIASQ